ncbi:hypothetical protein [Tunicatimonas pelagia]|uniref:hypothetical protein n=1 Tax=Tunicatimonas pelagia TaxID=931531 RepID=UPI002666FB5D|nr:hypothetical protein [Tunicatimonas pelagia]WKN40979.1 hypothetical protein P0M28_18255 [Tunicatimonas pelagia]
MAHWFLPAISIKVICGWLVGGLYLYYYSGGDTWNYHTDGMVLAELARTNWSDYLLSWTNTDYLPSGLIYADQPRALLMSRMVSVGCLFTQNNYWLTSSYLSIISFGGIWYLVQTLDRFFPRTQLAVGIAWLTYPSFVFWSSGILKETIAVGLMSLLVALTIQFYYRSRRQRIVPIISWLTAAILLWLIKYYYAALLIPLLLAITLTRFIPLSWPNIVVRMGLLFISLIALATLMHPNLEAGRILSVIVQNHDTFIRISHAEAVIHFYQLQPTFSSFLLNTPLAVFSAWYRPFPFEMNATLAQVAGLENFLLVVISVLSLRKIGIVKVVESNKQLWILATLLFSVLLGVLLAISTPNFGTLLRYKVAFSPFLLYLLLCLLLQRDN